MLFKLKNKENLFICDNTGDTLLSEISQTNETNISGSDFYVESK